MNTFRFEIPDSTPRKENNKHWQFCVGSGQAKLAVRSDYARQLKFIHDELGIQRVRFHGIFDDSMQACMGVDDFAPLPGSKKFRNYNFHNTGIAYDNILAAGMKPWVELSFMPSKLAKGKKKVAVNAEGRCTMPKDDGEWQAFLRAFIRYLLNRYGKEEVESWYFEVWNEPNMFAFFAGKQEDYFHLYEITVKAIRSVDDQLKVGGPATSNGDWIEDFIRFVEQNRLPCDFISTHNYPGEAIGEVFLGKIMFENIVGGAKRMLTAKPGRALDGIRTMMPDTSENQELAKGQMRAVTQKVAEAVAGRYPVYLSEWNCNGTLTAATNDDKKVAAFDVKTIDEMDDFVTGSSIWCFSDIFDEFLLLPDEFSGGFGLLTVNGIPKPQFHALKLMAGTGGRKYCLPYTNGEVEIAVYESDTEKRVFVYRQRMKNVAEPACRYDVELELNGNPESVSLYRIDKDHCNPKRIWEEMGSPTEMNPAQIEEIKAKSRLVEENLAVHLVDEKLHLNGSLAVNDVHCYIIKTE